MPAEKPLTRDDIKPGTRLRFRGVGETVRIVAVDEAEGRVQLVSEDPDPALERSIGGMLRPLLGGGARYTVVEAPPDPRDARIATLERQLAETVEHAMKVDAENENLKAEPAAKTRDAALVRLEKQDKDIEELRKTIARQTVTIARVSGEKRAVEARVAALESQVEVERGQTRLWSNTADHLKTQRDEARANAARLQAQRDLAGETIDVMCEELGIPAGVTVGVGSAKAALDALNAALARAREEMRDAAVKVCADVSDKNRVSTGGFSAGGAGAAYCAERIASLPTTGGGL